MFNRQHVVSLGAAVLVSLLAGCGQAGNPAASEMILTQRPHAAKAASAVAKAPAAATVNKQQSVIEIAAPAEVRGTGAIAMNFKFPEKAGYSVLATAADINKITVTLKTKGFLLTKTIATAEVQRTQIVNNMAAVNFTGLAGGAYIVQIDATDASNQNIGTTSENVTVTDGQTATLNSRLQLKASTTTTTPSGTGLGVNLTIVNG